MSKEPAFLLLAQIGPQLFCAPGRRANTSNAARKYLSANGLPVDDVSARHKSESELLRRFAARANVGERNERSECSEPRRGRRRAAEERQLGVSCSTKREFVSGAPNARRARRGHLYQTGSPIREI